MLEDLRDPGLDPELCARQTSILAGLGAAYMNESQSGRSGDPEFTALAAATNYRRAGASALLTDRTDEARKYFHEAVSAYAFAESPYSQFLANLSTQTPDEP